MYHTVPQAYGTVTFCYSTDVPLCVLVLKQLAYTTQAHVKYIKLIYTYTISAYGTATLHMCQSVSWCWSGSQAASFPISLPLAPSSFLLQASFVSLALS